MYESFYVLLELYVHSATPTVSQGKLQVNQKNVHVSTALLARWPGKMIHTIRRNWPQYFNDTSKPLVMTVDISILKLLLIYMTELFVRGTEYECGTLDLIDHRNHSVLYGSRTS